MDSSLHVWLQKVDQYYSYSKVNLVLENLPWLINPKKADCCTTVLIPMSLTPKKIEFTIMNDSARELLIARRDTFMSSAPSIPFFLMISIAGLM